MTADVRTRDAGLAPYVALLFVQIFFGTLPVFGKIAMREMAPFTLAAIRGVFGAVLLGTVGAYALNAWALARTGASTTAFFIYIQPLFAGVLAYFVLGETPSPRLFGAAVLIFTGVAFAIWPSRSARPAA